MVDNERQPGDKRRNVRKYLVFYLRVFDGSSFRVLGHVVNISAKGLMLLCDTAIAPNEEYHLRMKLPGEVADRGDIVFNATSRWCKKDAHPDFYVTGFEIHDLRAEEERNILCLIDEFSFIEH